MSKCTCSNPCSCYFEFDGDRPNTPHTLPFKYGRYSTRKKGSGTFSDPYIIEFLDSEEFQVEAGQVRTTSNQMVFTGAGVTSFIVTNYSVVDYETPGEIFSSSEQQLPAGNISPAFHKFWYVSAQATFVFNPFSTTGYMSLFINYNPPSDIGFMGGGAGRKSYIAGTSSTRVSEDVTLSCSGLAPFMEVAEKPFQYGPGGVFNLEVQQSSGIDMAVKDVRLSLVAI